MRFTLTIELGNAAMQTPEDVAASLRSAADYLDGIGVQLEGAGLFWHLDAGSVRDANGNTVGTWELS